MLVRHPLRRLAQLITLTTVATVCVVAPAPRMVAAQEVTTATERIDLAVRRVSRLGEAIGASAAAEPEARAALAVVGRRTARRSAETFESIGVTLPRPTADPVLVRGLVDGRWTPWAEAHFDATEAPDPGTEGTDTALHSQPIWLGGATAYEIDAPSAIATARVHLVRERTVARRVSFEEASAHAATPSIRSRAAWGARPPKVRPSTTADLRAAIVHHSVNANTYAATDVPKLLRSIQAYHMDVNGWNDIAYNFAVDRFGGTWEGRGGGVDRVVLGGHSAGFNTGTTGVVVLGDFRTASPTAASVEAVSNVIAWKFALHRVVPSSTVPYTTAGSSKYASGSVVTLPRIVGHRDVQSTTCPGAQLHARLPTIRSRVAQLVPGHQAARAPDLLDLDRNGDGLTESLEHRPGAPADQWWLPNGLGGLTRAGTTVSGTYRPFTLDYNGDRREDVFLYGPGSAPDVLWRSTGAGVTSVAVSVSGSQVPLVGDFDGNGADDVYWYEAGIGTDRIWYHEPGGGRVSVASKQDLVTGIGLVGRFNGDDRDDIFWYAPGPDADDALWLSTGRGWTSRRLSVKGYYRPVVLDASGDGIDDIQWVASGTTAQPRWDFKADGTFTARTITAPATGGDPYAGDFDGDGREDLFLYTNGAGADALWYSNGTTVSVVGVSVKGRFAVGVGPRGVLGDRTDDLLFVSNGPDHVWLFKANRTFTPRQVG